MQRDPTEHVAKASGTGGSDTDSLASTSAKSSILESWLMLEYCDLGSLSVGPLPFTKPIVLLSKPTRSPEGSLLLGAAFAIPA